MKLGISENKPEPVFQCLLIRHPLQDLHMYDTSLPYLNVLCRQNHCKKHTSSLSLCFSFFHTGDTVFEVLQEAQQCLLLGQEASDVNWKIFTQCSVFHMRLDQTHGEILQELMPVLCFIFRTCHVVQNMSIYACNVEELEKYA
jgi:hypothetical protein